MSQITQWVYAAALTHFAQQTPPLSGYCVVCFPPLCLSLMPLCPCNPSKSWALMHQLPYFSTEMTVACRESCTSCVCACVQLCHFWKTPCVLSAPALRLRKPPGSISSAARPHTPESCFGWKHVCFFSSHRKEDKLLDCLPILH